MLFSRLFLLHYFQQIATIWLENFSNIDQEKSRELQVVETKEVLTKFQ
jgi:hypothetical protein